MELWKRLLIIFILLKRSLTKILIFKLLDKVLFFCGSISGDSFTKPLSKEEEKKYVKLFEETGDKNAKDMLIKHNLRLVAHIVKKYNGADEADDLISVGSLGLIKAIKSFKPNHGTQFSTYASKLFTGSTPVCIFSFFLKAQP